MMNIRLVLCGIALVAASIFAGPANALKPTIEILEDAYELGMDEVTLPSTNTGTLRINTCQECETLTLQITGQSLAFIGKTQVTMGEFKEFAATSGAPLYVFYRFGTDEVTRIVLDVTQ